MGKFSSAHSILYDDCLLRWLGWGTVMFRLGNLEADHLSAPTSPAHVDPNGTLCGFFFPVLKLRWWCHCISEIFFRCQIIAMPFLWSVVIHWCAIVWVSSESHWMNGCSVRGEMKMLMRQLTRQLSGIVKCGVVEVGWACVYTQTSMRIDKNNNHYHGQSILWCDRYCASNFVCYLIYSS